MEVFSERSYIEILLYTKNTAKKWYDLYSQTPYNDTFKMEPVTASVKEISKMIPIWVAAHLWILHTDLYEATKWYFVIFTPLQHFIP